MQDEVWRTTERLRGFYEVSNLGRVRRIAPGPAMAVGHIKKTRINPKTGYEQVMVYIRNKYTMLSVHRLVCEAFHGSPSPGQETHHKNADRTCNRDDNLEWVTRSENITHAYKTGRKLPQLPHPLVGSENYMAKLSERDIVTIREDLKKGILQQEIAAKYGVSKASISYIKSGKTWSHVA